MKVVVLTDHEEPEAPTLQVIGPFQDDDAAMKWIDQFEGPKASGRFHYLITETQEPPYREKKS